MTGGGGEDGVDSGGQVRTLVGLSWDDDDELILKVFGEEELMVVVEIAMGVVAHSTPSPEYSIFNLKESN